MSAEETNRSKRIAKNTIVLYIRMIFVLGVSLYTSRVLLDVLGVKDYGVYNVVGGVVTMLGFLNGAMISSTQRFFSFAIGQNDFQQLSLNYSTILVIQGVLALLILLVSETLGLWFVKTYLVMPPERIHAAIWVFQFAVLTFVVSMLQVPFTALIITHERMNIFAYISIADILLKLLAVIVLPFVLHDKLIAYGAFLFIASVFSFTAYVAVVNVKFNHVRFIKQKNKALFKTLLSYTGWNLWGNAAAVIMNQGINILINIFFGPSVNAARAIGYQVQGAINQLVSNFQMAINPQIVKSYASGDLSYMHNLVIRGAKLSFFLIFAMALPVAIEADFFLSIWLKQVPEYAVIFTRLVLLLSCIDSLSGSLMIAAQASGQIKVYQSIIGGLLILNLPISYYALKLGANPEVTIYIAIGISIIALFARLKIITPLVGLKMRTFIRNTVLPSLVVAISSYVLSNFAKRYLLLGNDLKSIIIALISFVTTILLIVAIGLKKGERSFLIKKLFSNL